MLCVRKHKSDVSEEAQECCMCRGRKHKSAVCEEAQECCV